MAESGVEEASPGPLSADALCARVWTYGRPGAEPDYVDVRLFRDGSLGGLWAGREKEWRWRDGRLQFLDEADVRTVIFERLTADADGRLKLSGRATDPSDPSPQRELRERVAAPDLATLSSDLRILSRPGPKRRNLVVVRAGPSSLHDQWPKDIGSDDRSWDLCVSWYGATESFGRDPWAEHQVLQNEGHKFASLHALFPKGGAFWRYDHVAFPDDDLLLSWRDWNRVFAVCRRYGLHLAQPAITGYVNQPILHPPPGSRLRFTSWVEVQTPVFSREALRLCAPTFAESRSGYGLDHVWPKLLGEPENRVAIIDEVVAEHTRPGNTATGRYDYEAALREGGEVQGRYRAPWRTFEFGGMRQRPRVRPPAGHPEEEPD